MADFAERLRAWVEREGPVPFARFMERALYDPEGGYYTRPDRERARDYFTSPQAHPAFGALLALHLEELWEALGRPSPFTVAEPGAGDGLLAHDILSFAAHLTPAFFRSLRYLVSDLALPRRDLLASSPGEKERLRARGLPLRGLVGCVLTNEVVDAFPVHRFQIVQEQVREVYVKAEEGRFVEVLGEPSTPALREAVEALGLPEGYRGEVNLGIGPWLREVAGALERGFVLTIDYGDLTEGLYSPQRRGGTLRAFSRHTLVPDPFVRPGEQDITASVDFGALLREGERAGLTPLGFTTQREFLHNLGLHVFLKRLPSLGLPQREYLANRMGLLELARPGGLGDYKVLLQGKGVGRPDLIAFNPQSPRRPALLSRLEGLPLPLRTPQHAPLLEARYPHMAVDWERLWRGGEP